MRRTILALAATVLALACGPNGVQAQATPEPPTFETSGDAEFDAWRDDFARRAVARGRSVAAVRDVLTGLSVDDRVIELDRRQPEFVSPVWDYVSNRVTESRITGGRALKAEMGGVLPAVEERYGVDADIIVGIWGLESNYGQATLNYSAANALATLAFEGRRRQQFEGYLIALMEMVERGYADRGEMRSSWAGALGQPQFMPDMYLQLAVDWNGDGHRNIWTDRADVAASIGNYLQNRGWQRGQEVFDEVTLPQGFDYALADGVTRPISTWEAAGVRRYDGSAWRSDEETMQSQLFLPAGAEGPALLLHPNFAVIRRYNASDRYALVVALLARSFEGRPGLQKGWPRHLSALNRDETLELQMLLNGLGYDAGTADGLFGLNTRRAVRAFQLDRQLTADGFPDAQLLAAVRQRAGVSAPEPQEAPRPLDRAGIRELQRLLNRMGFDAGRADGAIGPNTRAAIRAFERREGLEVRGRATTTVLAAAREARRR